MELFIVAPNGIICRTTVDSVSFPGAEGRFSVLNSHAPIISSLTAGEIVYVEHGTENHLMIRGGFVRVYKNRIEVAVEMDDTTLSNK